MNKTLIINTGGTISMVHSVQDDMHSPLIPAKEWGDVTVNYPFLENMDVDYKHISKIVDSSNMSIPLIREIAEIIKQEYGNYIGFVVLHGTDTMAYTASALSFMLTGLNKPVILTGAQLPIQQMRSDGIQNLLSAVAIVEESYKTDSDTSILREVCIFFRDLLLRGNRTRKVDSSNYAGFDSPNYQPLAVLGSEITFNDSLLHNKDYQLEPLTLNTSFCEEVLVFDIFPGFNTSYLESIINAPLKPRGVIMRTFGSGNAPTSQSFLALMKKFRHENIIVVNITQCDRGGIEEGIYETNHLMTGVGVVSSVDMTMEATLMKLMYILGKTSNFQEIESFMEKNIIGELTE